MARKNVRVSVAIDVNDLRVDADATPLVVGDDIAVDVCGVKPFAREFGFLGGAGDLVYFDTRLSREEFAHQKVGLAVSVPVEERRVGQAVFLRTDFTSRTIDTHRLFQNGGAIDCRVVQFLDVREVCRPHLQLCAVRWER